MGLALDGCSRRGRRVGSLLLCFLPKAGKHPRWFCEVREQIGREDVWRMVVPALRRPERPIRIRFPVRELRGVQPGWTKNRKRNLQEGWGQELPYLAVPRRISS